MPALVSVNRDHSDELTVGAATSSLDHSSLLPMTTGRGSGVPGHLSAQYPNPPVSRRLAPPGLSSEQASHTAWLLPVFTPVSRPCPNFVCIPIPSNLLGLASDPSGRADAPAAGCLSVMVPAGTTLLLPVGQEVRRHLSLCSFIPSSHPGSCGVGARAPGWGVRPRLNPLPPLAMM